MKHPLKLAAVFLMSMVFIIGTTTAQEAYALDDDGNEAATISRLVDRIDALEEEKKALKAVNKQTLSESEKEAWKSELKSVRKELNKERNKLSTIEDINDPFRSRFGYYGAFGPTFGFGYYSPFFFRRGFISPYFGFRGFYY